MLNLSTKACLIYVLCWLFWLGCARQTNDDASLVRDQAEPDGQIAASSTPIVGREAPALFADITAEVGLDFTYEVDGSSDPYLMPKLMGGGAAVFDADADGDLDILLIDGPTQLGLRLFRQGRDGKFKDVTSESQLANAGYGMGCAVGDIDNDGDLDIYLTNYGADRLFRNAGDGTFEEITETAGINNLGWGTSAAFLDFDRDGWLDIYVTNYMELDETRECQDEAGRRDFCGPDFPEQSDRLYRNQGEGTFVDVTDASGVGSAAYAGLGVVCADLDDDGWVDIYVANDRDPNLLWVNQGDGTFVEDATLLGLAYNGMGMAEAGMGVTVGDSDNDGDLDLFVTHLATETNTLYRYNERQSFDDTTGMAGLGASSVAYTGWGTAFFDADLDSDLDLIVVNGAVQRRSSALRESESFWDDYAEPNLFYRNNGGGQFTPDLECGSFREEVAVSRGLVPFDVDGDGDQDLLVTNLDAPTRLYRNETAAARKLIIDTYDPELRREAVGAKLTIRVGDQSFVRHALPPGGYLTSGPSTIHFGFSGKGSHVAIDVRWPDGAEERFEPIAWGRVELRRGSGVSLP